MAIETRDPNTIWLGPGSHQITIVNHLPVAAALLPGTLVQRVGGEYVAHADAGGTPTRSFLLDQPELNKGVDEAYAEGDLAVVGVGTAGDTFWAWLASGENVADGDELQSNGAGMLEPSAAAEGTVGIALEAKNSAGGDARIRLELT